MASTETISKWTVPLLLVTLLFLHSVSSSEQTGSFGDICDLNRPCDQLQNLACINNTCQCESPSNQRYDNSSKKCLSVVGGPCTSETSLPSAQQGTDSDLNRKKDCIKNAHCVDVPDERGNTFTECQCLENFIENSAGECVPGIGQPCSYLPNECNPLGMVVCKNGKCQCLDELQIYDSDIKRCVSPAGTHCKYDDLQLGCVKNALCYPFFYWIPPKCLCKPGYVQTKSRQCAPESEYNKKHLIEQTSKKSHLNSDVHSSLPNLGSGWPQLPIPILGNLYINHTAN